MKNTASQTHYQVAAILVSLVMATLLGYAAWLSFDAGKRTPDFTSEHGLRLSAQDLRRATTLDGIELDQHFFFLIPEFRHIDIQQGFLEKHRLVWTQISNNQTNELGIGNERVLIYKSLPSTGSVLARYGAMYVVAALFAIGALISLWRYKDSAGRAASLILFGAGLFTLSLPTLATRGLTLPYDSLDRFLDLYFISTCAFAALIYFPFTYNSNDLPNWPRRIVFWILLLKTLQVIYGYFMGTAAIAEYAWFTNLCVVLFVCRVCQRTWTQRNDRSVTHLVLCYIALTLPTLTFSALVSWPELLAVELGSLQYFVLTSTVVPIAMVSLLESDLLQRRNQSQALQLEHQQSAAEQRSQEARQTVIMNLHDHVARSLDSISALALRAKLSGDGSARLDSIRAHAMHAHRALRGLFSVSGEDCDSWPALRVQLREFGNTLIEQQPFSFQLREWPMDDESWELDANVKLVCFHVMSEAITNAVKYAEPSKISVDIGATEKGFSLRVSDDGSGFNPSSVDNSRHHGLNIMRKRANLIQADLEIASSVGAGTCISLRGPLSPASEVKLAYQLPT